MNLSRYSWLPSNADEYRRWYDEYIPEGVKPGTCWCGCNRPAKIFDRTVVAFLHFKGERGRYYRRHNRSLDTRYTVVDRGCVTPCWIWNGHINRYGYGVLSQKTDGQMFAHRWMLQRTGIQIPEYPAYHVHHECSQRDCCNPEHLTILDNTSHRRTYNLTFSRDDVQRIRQLISEGYSDRAIAVKYNTVRENVRDLKLGKHYRDW